MAADEVEEKKLEFYYTKKEGAEFQLKDAIAENTPPPVKIVPPQKPAKEYESDKLGSKESAGGSQGEPAIAEATRNRTEQFSKKEAAKRSEATVADESADDLTDQFKSELEAAEPVAETATPKPATVPVTPAEDAYIDGVAVNEKNPTSQTIRGQVLDSSGEPLIGASVVVENTENGAVTDVYGIFTLDSPIENPALTIGYTGFETQQVQVSGDEFLNIQLSEGMALEEVVVTNLGRKQRNKTAEKNKLEPKGGFEKFKKYVAEKSPKAASRH